jgi:hypothetical protein
MLPFMNHSQHFDEVVGFDLVENSIGVKPQFAHGVFVQFRYLVTFAGQGIESDGFAYQLFTDTLGVEWRVLGDVIMNMVELCLGVVRPLHHVRISLSTSSADCVLPSAASCWPRRIFSRT